MLNGLAAPAQLWVRYFNCGGTDCWMANSSFFFLCKIQAPSWDSWFGVRGIPYTNGESLIWVLKWFGLGIQIYSPIIWYLLACKFSMIRRLAPPCRNRQNLQFTEHENFVMFNKLKLKYKADASKISDKKLNMNYNKQVHIYKWGTTKKEINWSKIVKI